MSATSPPLITNKRKHYSGDGEYCDDPWPRKTLKTAVNAAGDHPGFLRSSEVTAWNISSKSCSATSMYPATVATTSPKKPKPLSTSAVSKTTTALIKCLTFVSRVLDPTHPGTCAKSRCRHPIHPAYSNAYTYTQCPLCRVILQMHEVEYINRYIKGKGGVGRWWQDILNMKMSGQWHWEEYADWYMTIRGRSRQNPNNVDIDEDGNDLSYRYANVRMYRLVDELEKLSELEKQAGQESMNRNKSFSAAKALRYYENACQDGTIHCAENDSASFARSRGREWEIAADPDYPDDISEPEDANRAFHTTADQRAFIAASTVPVMEYDKPNIIVRKQRRTRIVHVTFDPKVRVRAETDINALRHQALDKHTPTYETYPLAYDQHIGRKRNSHRFHISTLRRYENSEKVDTSGRRLKDLAAWEELVEVREEEWRRDEIRQGFDEFWNKMDVHRLVVGMGLVVVVVVMGIGAL